MPIDKFFTDEQIQETLKFLGKFHAISHAKKIKEKDFSWDRYHVILDDYFAQDMTKPFFNDPVQSFLNLMSAVIKEKANGNPLVNDINLHGKNYK